MREDSESNTRTSLLGTAAIAAFAVAAVVLGFAPSAPLATVLVTSAVIGGSVSFVAYVGFARPLLHQLAAERAGRSELAAELDRARSRRTFVEQLDGAVDMADTEDEAIEIVGRALAMLLPDRDNAVLLAPPADPRVTWLIPAGPDGLHTPEALGEPMRCSALSAGRVVTTESSGELDACPHLAQQGWEVSSMCVPIRIGEQHLGVAHSAGPAGDLPDEEARRLIELVTRRVGARIAVLRERRRHVDHVALDPLTRLPTHTAAQRRLRELLGDEAPFSVAFCDLDGFAAYNDAHGAEQGDDALRTYADVMGATLRPGDLVARFAGDRFLCVFPNCSAQNAASAMERVRESLVLELTLHGMAPFTSSVGVADSADGTTVEALLELADVALAVAKHSGGNRVVVDEFDGLHLTDS